MTLAKSTALIAVFIVIIAWSAMTYCGMRHTILNRNHQIESLIDASSNH